MSRLAVSSFFALLLLPCSGSAQTLREAREAYARVDFDGTVSAAEAALRAGGHAPEETAELYRLAGLAHAALDHAEPARDAFVRLLAIDPEVRLERRLSPALRSPYMEARGFWAQFGDLRIAIDVTLDGTTLRARTRDPAQLAATMRVRHRAGPGAEWARAEGPTSVPLELTAPERVEVIVELLDAHFNVLVRRGSDDAPERLGAWREESAGPPPPPPDPTPFYASGGAALALGVGGVVVGAIFHADHESLAAAWNEAGPQCTGTGTTRAQVCANVGGAIAQTETLMGVMYGLGGALAVVGAVLFAAAPGGSSTPGDGALRCAPGVLSIACGGTF